MQGCVPASRRKRLRTCSHVMSAHFCLGGHEHGGMVEFIDQSTLLLGECNISSVEASSVRMGIFCVTSGANATIRCLLVQIH